MQSKRDMFCFSCLCPLSNMIEKHCIEASSLRDKLSYCIQQKNIAWDKYPQSICNGCYKKVSDFYEFQKMCHYSMEKFMIIVENEKDIENIIDINIESNMGKDCLETSLEVVDEVNPVHEDEKTNVEEINIISRDHMQMKNPTTQEEYVLEEKEYGNDLFQDPPCDDQLQCDESPKLSSKSRGQPPYICGYGNCKRQFNRWVYYEKHLKHHNCSTVIFKCDVINCNRKYKNKSALNIHQRKAHNIGPELKQHMCEKCGKVFKSSTVLKDHSFTHVDRSELPFVCDEADCSKKFSTKEKLKIHKLRHAGVRNYICPHCGMRKTTRNELKIHINYHTIERTWPCQFCSKVCNSAGNLKMHVRNIHERTKDFACSYCERTFAKADTRKYHEMTHTGEKPHACEICGRRFLQPAALRTHRKIHRKIENSTDSKEVGT